MNPISNLMVVPDDAVGGNVLPLDLCVCNGDVCVGDFLALPALFIPYSDMGWGIVKVM